MEKQRIKIGKRLTSLLLAVAMFMTISGIPVQAETTVQQTREMPKNPIHHCTSKDDGTDTTDWSYVYFGSYPQTEVTGDALISSITGASYDADGDAWVNGAKYRRISKGDTNNTDYFGNSDYRYFKWERIKWRVLSNDGSTLFVAADKGLDCKDYSENYPDGSLTWENCTLRNWLNISFYGTAFSSSEQRAIVSQTVVNEDNSEYGIEGGNNTDDKVYLLSIGEVTNSTYGFCETYRPYSPHLERCLKPSDYAHARGVYIYKGTDNDYEGGCGWWLRSPGSNTNSAACVNIGGHVISDNYISYSSLYKGAVVPVLHINLSSDLWFLADDGSSGGGGDGGTGKGIEHVTTASNNQIEIRAYDIGNGMEVAKPMKDALVNVDRFGNTLTDADGKAVIENTLTDQPLVNTKISIAKEGYREYYFYKDIYNKDAELLWENNQQTVWMRKLQEKDRSNPYISTLICQTSYGTTYDAMVNRRIYRNKEKGQNIKIQINAVWNGKTPDSYILYQENGISYTSTDGKFSLDMGKDFEAKYPIYAKLIAADGTTVTEKTNFEITGSSSSAKPGDSLELIHTDSTGTLGEDIAFLSGENVSVELGGAKLDVSVEAGKIRVTIGKEKKDLSSKGEVFSNEDWKEWKELCEHQPTDLNLSQWKNVIESIDMDWTGNLKGKTEVYGYLEGTVNNTGNTVLTGKVKLKTSLSAGIQTQYMIGVIPAYAKISVGVDGGAEGALAFNWTEKKIDTENTGITLSLEPYLAAEGGVGVMAVAEIGVEGKGSTPFSTKLGTNDDTKLSVKGGLSLKAKLLVFEYSLKLAEAEVKLLPIEESQSATWEAGISELSMDDFELSDNRYLDEESIWLGDSTIQPFSLETTETGAVERILKTNINPDADMQMVTAGDTKMVFWTEGDPQRAAINNSKLVYSIYHAADNTWSAPETVADDGTADFAPSVVSDGEQIYVAWQNISREFANDADLSEVAAASTVAMSVWRAGEGFSNPVTVSETGYMAVTPQIALNVENKPCIAYLQNTDNNLLLTTGQNNICYSVVDGSDIERKSFVENAGLVTAMDISCTNGFEISYTLDKDNDLSTLEDREIIRKGTANTATQNDCLDSNAKYVKNGSQNLRFWYQDGSIVMSDMGGDETVVYQDDTGTLTDDFHVVSGLGNQLAVIWTAIDEDGNKQIEGSLYDSAENTWSKSIQISDTDASVYNPQGIFTEDGRLQFLYKKTGDTQTDLCLLMVEPSVNLAVETAYCDETAFVPGSMAKVRVQVKNNGSKKAGGFTVDIEGTKTIVSESLAPGESAVVEADYMVPADMGYQEISIVAEADGDIDTTDNHFSLSVGYTDLAVNVTDSRLAFGQLVEIRTVNQSCVDTAATLEVRKGSREGQLVKKIDLGTIAKGELVTATYLWNEDAENYSADTETLYFSVVSEKPEKYVDNNYDFTVTETYIDQDIGQDTDQDKVQDTDQDKVQDADQDIGQDIGQDKVQDIDSKAALTEAKNKAKRELVAYRKPEDYRETQKKELIKAITDGKNAIDFATDEAGVKRALSDAKAVIDRIKTNAQLTEEEEKARINISSCKVTLSRTSYTYDGKKKEPIVTVKAGKIKLIKNRDYTVSYKNAAKVGKAYVEISGKGKYTGKITKAFKILPQGTSISGKITAKSRGFTMKWKKQKKSASGYQIQYSSNKKFTKKTTITKTVKKNSTTKLTVKKLKAKKKYYVRIRTYKTVNGKKYCSGWSKVKIVTTKK